GLFGIEGSLELGHALGWLVSSGGEGRSPRDAAGVSGDAAGSPGHLGSGRAFGPTSSGTTGLDPAGELAAAGGNSPDTAPALIQVTGQARSLEPAGAPMGTVPDSVLQGNEAMQRGFLQALFTADGALEEDGSRPRIRLG